MRQFLAKIPLIKNLVKDKDEDVDWENPRATLEVISKKELDKLQQETVNDLNREQVINPKALFYVHEYIDSKFSKKDFNVEDRFNKKANLLDQLYSEGKAEIYAEYTGYGELIERAKEADMRLRRAIVALDPKTVIATEDCKLYDDSAELKAQYDALVDKLNWEER